MPDIHSLLHLHGLAVQEARSLPPPGHLANEEELAANDARLEVLTAQGEMLARQIVTTPTADFAAIAGKLSIALLEARERGEHMDPEWRLVTSALADMQALALALAHGSRSAP